MEIKINVDESMFKGVLEKELLALTPDQIKELVMECIQEFFRKDDYANVENILVHGCKDTYAWGNERKLTAFAEKLIEQLDFSGLQDVADKSVEYLKDNCNTLMQKIVMDMILKSLTNEYSFHRSVEEVVRQMNR